MLKILVRVMFWLAIPAVAFSQITPTPNPRYFIKGGEVYDKDTNLTWQRCSVGQQWNEGNGCVGAVAAFAFTDALKQGNGTWRVPTIEELATLVDENRSAINQKPTIDEAAFPNMNGPLWYCTIISTLTSISTAPAIAVNFDIGSVQFSVAKGDPKGDYAVRLVRSGN